jgi:predicted dehydrogenase
MVVDVDFSRAEALASMAGARAGTDWREVTDSNVDIVIVAVTPEWLPVISLAALEAGKHLLVEKPGARSAAEIAPVAAAARLHGRIAKVGFNHRFHPAVLKAKEIIDIGGVGTLMFLRGRYGHGGRPGYEREWRCQPEISGGGELLDQGSHLIDLSRWFLGDLTLMYAATPTFFWDTTVDDNCFLVLQAKDGQLAWLHASWSEWKNMFSFEIYGRTGKLAIEGLGGSYGVERLTHYAMLPEMGPPETTTWEYPRPDSSWITEVRHFVAAIREGQDSISNLDDTHAVLTIIDQAYERS